MNRTDQLKRQARRLSMLPASSVEEQIDNQIEIGEISEAIYLANLFFAHTVLDDLNYACRTHGLQHCPVCDNEQQWPGRATRGDLIP